MGSRLELTYVNSRRDPNDTAEKTPGVFLPNHRGRLDLHLGPRLDQVLDDDNRHRGEVAAEDLAVVRADRLAAEQIFITIGDVPRQAGDVLDAGAGGAER